MHRPLQCLVELVTGRPGSSSNPPPRAGPLSSPASWSAMARLRAVELWIRQSRASSSHRHVERPVLGTWQYAVRAGARDHIATINRLPLAALWETLEGPQFISWYRISWWMSTVSVFKSHGFRLVILRAWKGIVGHGACGMPFLKHRYH